MKTVTTGERLLVSVANNQVGQIIRAGTRACTFVYDRSLRVDQAVSLIMPVEVPVYQTSYYSSLHPVFEMNLPEGRLRDEIQKKFSKALPDFDDLTLLGMVGCTTIGRLRYGWKEDMFSVTSPPPCDILEMMSYEGTEDLLAYLMNRYANFSGVAGVQPKVLVQDKKNLCLSDAAKERLTARDATHIIKAWESDYPGLAANEFFCMQAAARSGLTTPATLLSTNGKLLAIERFDMNLNTGEYWGFEDFCALSNLPSRKKYSGSYERLAKGLSVFLDGEFLTTARRDFFKIMVLNCMVRNGDAHLKNFGIVYSDPKIENRFLAPAFDIVTSTAYISSDTMALTLGGCKKWPDRKRLNDFGLSYCHLSRKDINHIFEHVAEAITDTRHALQMYAKDHSDFFKIGEIILKEWNHGVSSIMQDTPSASISPKKKTSCLNP